MTTKSERRYSTFAHLLDLEAFYQAIEFEPTGETTSKRGDTLDVGYCPDPWKLHKHGDTTGKFAVNRELKTYNCWVCGGGSVLSLAMVVMGMTEQEAEEWLFQFAKPANLSADEFMAEWDALVAPETTPVPPVPWFNERVIEPYEANLGHIEAWLADRGISMETACKARLGFESLSPRMAPIKGAKARERPYSGPSVYLPHFWGEKLVGWQQRWLDEDRPHWIGKYTNTSNFPKSETIYNFENVYLAERPVIVAESVMTVLFLTSIGYPAVATFGGTISARQLELLRKLTQGLVLAPDNDQVGYKWLNYTEAERKHRTLDRVVPARYLARWVPLRVIEPVGEYDSGNDLADLLDEGLPFAAKAIGLLYDEADYYYTDAREH